MTEKMRVESIADAHDVDVIAARDIANEQPLAHEEQQSDGALGVSTCHLAPPGMCADWILAIYQCAISH
jgi:hypothetical protein